MSIHRLNVVAVVLVVALVGCGRSKKIAQEAEAKKAQQTEIDVRAMHRNGTWVSVAVTGVLRVHIMPTPMTAAAK